MDSLLETIKMLEVVKELFDFSFAKRIKAEQESYRVSPTISSAFNWAYYDNKQKIMELTDGKSIGTVYELSAIPTEGENADFIKDLRLQFSDIFADVFPRYDDTQSPWIVSFYVSDDIGLDEAFETMQLYVDDRAKDQPYTKLYLNWWKRHCEALSRDNGLFVDRLTGLPAKGCTRRLRLVIYRNLAKKSTFAGAKNIDEELENICIGLESHFKTVGLIYKRYDENLFHRWMTK